MGLFDLFKTKKKFLPPEAQHTPESVAFGGGDGTTIENAVVINATSSVVGVDAEYQWLTSRLGKQDRDWKIALRMQSDANGRAYETFIVNLTDGSSKTVTFDISSFYGRF